ncbi:MAG: hypothetical protein KJ792_07795 [Actinobacteria bacterium]|nr:hypothetical protein [Actinomycetota bacterium]MCG2801614.1 hypothetical protein [Cellulomonas sp.]
MAARVAARPTWPRTSGALMADLAFVALTLVCFAALALFVRGLEKL